MLEELSTFIGRTPTSYSLSMPRLNTYLRHLVVGTARVADRNRTFVTDPIPSGGIDIINSLIVRADIPYLIKSGDTGFELLSKVNHEYHSPLYSDFIRQYAVHEKCFSYSQNKPTVEYLLITEDFDFLTHVPIGSMDWSKWLKVRPLRMLSNDSNEIQLDIVTSRLRYRVSPPKEIVLSLNIPKLLMTYIKYRTIYPEDFENNPSNFPFIYHICLLPLLQDNARTWVMKIIHDVVVSKSSGHNSSLVAEKIITGEKSKFVLGNLQSALSEIEDMIDKCAHGKMKPDEVMTSIRISPGRSLYDEINWLMDSHFMGSRGAQYRWADFEREYFALSTMLAIYNLQPDSNRSQELRKLFKIISKRLRNTQFWMSVGSPYVSAHIKAKFNSMCEIM